MIPDEMKSGVAWLIERPYAGRHQFLTPHGTGMSGATFQWADSTTWAIRFSRRIDAEMFIGAWRLLSRVVPHGQTTPGLRDGDELPLVVDHIWMDGPPAESEGDRGMARGNPTRA